MEVEKDGFRRNQFHQLDEDEAVLTLVFDEGSGVLSDLEFLKNRQS